MGDRLFIKIYLLGYMDLRDCATALNSDVLAISDDARRLEEALSNDRIATKASTHRVKWCAHFFMCLDAICDVCGCLLTSI